MQWIFLQRGKVQRSFIRKRKDATNIFLKEDKLVQLRLGLGREKVEQIFFEEEKKCNKS